MSASEFAFLALGLVLGVASGAALIEVLRAHPPVSREVRVTVAPNAIHSRMAATLADPHGVGDPVGPARGGPGDWRFRDDLADTGEPAATGRRIEDQGTVHSGAPWVVRSGTPVRSSAPATGARSPAAIADRPAAASDPPTTTPGRPPPTERPDPLWLRPAAGGPRPDLVAVPMSLEPDPITTALRASAAASAVAAMASSARTVDQAAGSAPGAVATGERGDSPSPRGETQAGASDVSLAESAGPTGAESAATPSGPCAAERRVADERCSVASRAREGAGAAAEAHRQTQRKFDEHVAEAEAGAARTDPRAVRTAKEQAQQRFRDARTGARTRDDVETGAREWLAEINRINQDTRDAALAVERDRAAAVALAPSVERLAVEADAARISAERADEACIAAREAVAGCDEARTLEDADRIGAANPEPEEEFAFSTQMHSQAGQDARILQILRGDRESMQHAVARLAGDDPDARRRWQSRLGALAEALIARSIEASAFDFPIDHPFWGPFNQSQNRDIAAGLSSLGFRFDGFGGWVDERLPTQRDLSLAVGYAGLDPMRVRRWPNESEMRDLFRDVRVAADEYVAGAAGGLTLGELVTLLGRRSDGLTELWNEWGSVRPILLEAG